MKKRRFTEQQIIGFLKEAEAGVPVKELCRKHGFSEAACPSRSKASLLPILSLHCVRHSAATTDLLISACVGSLKNNCRRHVHGRCGANPEQLRRTPRACRCVTPLTAFVDAGQLTVATLIQERRAAAGKIDRLCGTIERTTAVTTRRLTCARGSRPCRGPRMSAR